MCLEVRPPAYIRIGQGFNTYTQELRLEGAVQITQAQSAAAAASAFGASTTTGPSSDQSSGANKATSPALFPPEATNATAQPAASDGSLGKQDIIDVPAVKISGPVDVPATPNPSSFNNATMIADNNATIIKQVSTAQSGQLYSLPTGPVITPNQSVTFSARAVDNISDIMDALNISASMSIKYGTIHGNGSAAYVNENKVLSSQMNYIVSVKVNNNAVTDPETMDFQPIEDVPPENFTELYGDCFISGKCFPLIDNSFAHQQYEQNRLQNLSMVSHRQDVGF